MTAADGLRPDGYRASGTIGLPAAHDPLGVEVVATDLRVNIGDPEHDGYSPGHTNDVERDVVAVVTGMFGGSTQACWGYVTQMGSTEGNLWGAMLAREHHPGAVFYHSEAAHHSAGDAARLLGMEDVVVPADADGEIDYAALTLAVRARAGRPVHVHATIGTTSSEAVDDVAMVRDAVAAGGADRVHVHADAAMAGVPLALDGGPVARLLADGPQGADSLAISGHKFLGTLRVCGVAIARREHVARISQPIPYKGTPSPTISGCRDGHSAIELWRSLVEVGPDEHRRRAARAREVALHATERLRAAGWEVRHRPGAFTVAIRADALPDGITGRLLAPPDARGDARLVCMPGVTTRRIDELLEELGPHPRLVAAGAGAPAGDGGSWSADADDPLGRRGVGGSRTNRHRRDGRDCVGST